MKPLFSAILVLLFLVPAPSSEASSRMTVVRATAAHQGNSLRCRRIQRAAQSVMAGNSLQAYEGLHQRIAKKPRRLVKRMVGYAHKRGEVTRGCFRCIARQFVHRVPVALQAPCGLHSPCVPGGKLDETDACAALVCADKPECCSTEWTADCVEKAKDVCDLNCTGCLHDICETGAALDSTCDPCAAQICESDTFCCDTEWNDECVGQVTSVCQKPCDGTTTTCNPSTTTVPQGTTTTIDAATTSSLPGGTTIPGATTTTVAGATTTTIVGPTTTLGSPTTTVAPCEDNIIDFEDQPAGTNISTTQTSQGQPVTIK